MKNSQLLLMGIVGGTVGTVMMDLTNKILSDIKLINRMNIRGIGRVATGWLRGKFVHKSLDTVPNVKNELLNGIVAHYAIGVSFGFIFSVLAVLFFPEQNVTLHAIIFGALTTLPAWLGFFPSIGWGIMARKAPPANHSWAVTSLVNHVNFGIGLAIGINLLGK